MLIINCIIRICCNIKIHIQAIVNAYLFFFMNISNFLQDANSFTETILLNDKIT